MPNQVDLPFPIQLEVEFLDRLSEPVREGKAKSVSAIIRGALEHFDFEEAVVLKPAQIQISVRLPVEIRKNLKRLSRSKHTSVGHLVRAAVERYLPEIEALPSPDETKAAAAPRPRAGRKKAAGKKPSAGKKKSGAKKSAKKSRS